METIGKSNKQETNSKPSGTGPKEFGFGNQLESKLRLINKDGTFNVNRTGLPVNESFHLYHYLISINWALFLFFVFLWYFSINLLFTLAYLAVGVDSIGGMVSTAYADKVLEVFFFSTQSFTTVGYGRLNPVGIASNVIASIESLSGLLSFALVTGLLYGRFSRPSAKLLFSAEALIAPYKEINAFQFRLANKLKSQMIDLKCQVIVSFLDDPNNDGKRIRVFFPLKLERESVLFLPTTWTVVHPIDENSPLKKFNEEQFRNAEFEFMILFQAWDDRFYQNVNVSFSYRHEEVVWGAKFKRVLTTTSNGYPSIDLSQLHEYEPAQLN